ncbi:MAG: chromate transporter [Tatlockia sp.]|jgi:chromate transporter
MTNNLLAIVLSFTKIGLITLGGGNAMLKILEYEAVHYRHWISPEEFVGMVGSTFLFPGLTGVKLAALIGYKAAGMLGLILAVTCLNLPGLVMALIGYQILSTYQNPVIKKVMIAVQYGALALLAAATYSVGQGVVEMYYSLPIAIAAFVFFAGLAFFQLSPFWGFLGFIGVCYFLIRTTT